MGLITKGPPSQGYHPHHFPYENSQVLMLVEVDAFKKKKINTKIPQTGLVVEPTHLEKYDRQIGFIFPKVRGEKKSLKPPPSQPGSKLAVETLLFLRTIPPLKTTPTHSPKDVLIEM